MLFRYNQTYYNIIIKMNMETIIGTESIVAAMLFHYIGFLVILVIDSIDYVKKVLIVRGRTFL